MIMVHILIIGGTKGIGKYLAKMFANTHKVSILGRTKIDDQIKQVHFFQGDLNEDISNILDEIINQNGKIDNLIFVQRYRGEEDSWDGEVQIGLTATKNIIEHLADKMIGSKSIIIIGSIAGDVVFEEQPVGYHVVKAGLPVSVVIKRSAACFGTTWLKASKAAVRTMFFVIKLLSSKTIKPNLFPEDSAISPNKTFNLSEDVGCK